MLTEEQKIEALDAFAKSLTRKRKEAVDYRKNSGIERIWQEDNDYYEGIDASNSAEHYHKPSSMDGAVTYIDAESDHSGSNLFTNITQMYVDGCASRVIDMLTPTNEKPFKFEPTPIPGFEGETLKRLEELDKSGQLPQELMQALVAKENMPIASLVPPAPNNAGSMAQNPMMNGAPMPLPDAGQPAGGPQPAQQEVQANGLQPPGEDLAVPSGGMMMPPPPEAPKDKNGIAAEKAETQIWDWLTESGWNSELRKVVQDMARVGTGCLKGPFPYKSVSRKAKETDVGMELIQIDEIKPGSKSINCKNLFPDPACGDDIHNGSYIWERDFITSKQLSEMLGMDYIDSQIKMVLKEGPNKIYSEDNRLQKADSDKFEIWYFHGFASADDMEAANYPVEDGDNIPCQVVMVNDRVIKATLNVLDSGKFPYDVFLWQSIESSCWGKGVGRIVRSAQRMLNATVRNMLDNIALAGGPQIILRDGVISPADGEWVLTPRKLWVVDNNADVAQVQHAITSVVIPSMMGDLMAAIKFSMETAERLTAMPLMMQGQQGQATETVGGMEMLQKNASTVLRRIARMFDDRALPHLHRYYEYLMMYGTDEDAKGDVQIVALGSSALYERDAQSQFINSIAQLVMNPAFGLSPSKWMEQFLRSNKVDPATLKLSDEEKQAMAEQKPPEDPRIAGQIQVAQIRTQGELQKAQLVQQADMNEIKFKEQLAATELQMKMDEAELQREHEIKIMQMKHEMEMMMFSQQTGLTLQQVKADLASTSMKVRTQKELSLAALDANQKNNKLSTRQDAIKHTNSIKADLYKHDSEILAAPSEPTGKAVDGQAYAQ